MSGTLLVLAAIACLVAAMQQPAWPSPRSEQIEIRSYATFIVPDTGGSPVGQLKMMVWRFRNPGHARVLAAMARAGRKSPSGLQSPQQVFEELGLKFPSGCYARPGVGGCVDVAHYPSILNEIEKRLNLMPVRTNTLMKAFTSGVAEPTASPNGGPAERLGSSGVGGGPPSVS